MKNKFLTLVLCTFLPAMAITAAQDPTTSQIGRYQMVAHEANGNVNLWLVDTATGYVWRSDRKNSWVLHDTWVLQIATPPGLN